MRAAIHRHLAKALVMALLAPGLAADAAVESGVEFADVARVDAVGLEGQLDLCATGLLRYRVIFKGYAAALYLDDCAATQAPLAPIAKRLELAYFWSIDGELFGEAAEKVLRESLDAEAFAALEPRLARLHRSYRSVEPGDRYALTYVPGRGTELAHNGRVLQTIPGADFARAYFGIWLGASPIDEGLRNALLAPDAAD